MLKYFAHGFDGAEIMYSHMQKKLCSFSKKISSNLKSQFKLKQKLRSVIIHYEELYVTLSSHDLVAFKEIIW